MSESFAYDLIKAGKYKWAAWLDISIDPPINIYILVNIRNWGCAIGRLSPHGCFMFSLPHSQSPCYMTASKHDITHWAVIPELEEQ
jgi:hypothetical protein